jgi:predicted RNA-binding protein with PIN domain
MEPTKAATRSSTWKRPSSQRLVRRRRSPLPSNVDTVEGASWMPAATRATVVVDGYDVAELGWPREPLTHQREQLLHVLDDLVCRNAVDVHVVFDGVETGPVRAGGSRQASASFSRREALAVEEIRSRVQAVPATRPVIVVTDDAAVAHEAWADGANVLASRLFLAVVGHPVGETSFCWAWPELPGSGATGDVVDGRPSDALATVG